MNILPVWKQASNAIIHRSVESVWKCWVTQETQVSMITNTSSLPQHQSMSIFAGIIKPQKYSPDIKDSL